MDQKPGIPEQPVVSIKPMETKLSIVLPADGNNYVANVGILPEDILVEVLSRLPVKHLMRMRCVSKSWCSLIAGVNLVFRHYDFHYWMHKLQGDNPLFLVRGMNNIMSELMSCKTQWDEYFGVFRLSRQQGGDDDVLLDMTADLVRDSSNFLTTPPFNLSTSDICVGVVNGVFCFLWENMEFGLWNPATREFKPVAPPSLPGHGSNDSFVGFGFDHVSNDFKIFQQRRSVFPYEYYIYSLTSNTWKKLREPPVSAITARAPPMHAYLKGVCYWRVDTFYDNSTSGNKERILSCNLQTEVLKIFDLPQGALGPPKNGYEYNSLVTLYMDSLALVVSCTDWEKTASTFDVWVVTSFHGDSGIPVSWKRMFTIGPFPSSDGIQLKTFTMNGDVVFLIRPQIFEEQTTLYNLSTGTFKNLGVSYVTFHGYIESLLPLSKRLLRS